MALSELRRRKQLNLFNVYDTNRDGRIDKEDVLDFARRLREIRSWSEGSAEDVELTGMFSEYWDYLARYDESGDGTVTADEWMVMYEQFPKDEVRDWGSMLYSVLDADGDESITVEEYKQFFDAAGIGSDFADAVFPTLDDDGDGTVSRAEFIGHILDFDGSDDPSAAGNRMFGPV